MKYDSMLCFTMHLTTLNWLKYFVTYYKGPSISVNIFMSVQTIHFSGGLWKSKYFPYTFKFLALFLIFSWGFLALKNVNVYSFGGRGVFESVWFVHSWKCWHLWMAPNWYEGYFDYYKLYMISRLLSCFIMCCGIFPLCISHRNNIYY